MLEELPFLEHPYAAAAVLAAFLGLCVWGWVLWRRYNSPREKERRRRSLVHAQGRLTDGTVTDLDIRAEGELQGLIHYTYSIGGVEYSAAQDVSDLLDSIEQDPSRIIGGVNVKYHARNPFNSIVVCEGWSGLRRQTRRDQQFRPLR